MYYDSLNRLEITNVNKYFGICIFESYVLLLLIYFEKYNMKSKFLYNIRILDLL